MLPGIGTAMTAAELEDELKKDKPDYVKVGLLAGSEIIGLIPGLGTAAKTAIRKGANMMRQTEEVISNIPKVAQTNRDFQKTVKGYKLFTKGEDGKLYPLFVDADTEVPIGQYLKAAFPEYRFKAKNGNFYVPSRGTKGAKGTGDMIEIPDQETRDMLIEAGFLKKGSKAKSIRAVAARPGWHAGDNPTAKHIGPEVKIDGKSYKIRGDNQVWAEVEMPADVDWQSIADSRAMMKKDGTPNVKTAHITDELPFGGYYRYKTNPNMEGNWLISGDMKVLRELDKDEVKQLNKAAGVEDLPTLTELEQQLGIGLASGGIVGDNMYKGMDDYLMSEMTTGMAAGGVAEQMEMNFGPTPNPVKGVDPVSGNEIPVGSTAENVRDDIPANLSEGEMVIAADVVNFYGIKFFEDLRDNAKREYARMDEEGRIGGQPMEEPMMGNELGLDISDLEVVESMDEPVNAAEGVLASDEPFYSKRGGFDMSKATVPVDGGVGTPGDVSAGIVEIRQYQNDEGHIISVTFIDGVAQSEIPEGYYPVAPVVGADTPAQTQEPSGGSDRDRDTPMPEGIKYEELTIDELAKLVEAQQDSVIGGGLSRLMMGSVPVLGVAVRMALWDQNRRLKNEIERRLADPNLSDIERMQLNNLRIIKGETTFFDRLFGKDVPSMVATPADNEDFIKRVIQSPEDFLPPSMAGAEPYTPDVYDPSDKTPDVAGLDPQIMQKVKEASAVAAEKAFGKPAYTNPALDPQAENRSDRDDSPTTVSAPSSYTYTQPGGLYSEPGRPTQTNDDEDDKPERQDLTGLGYINKGALIQKKKATKKKK